MTKIGLVASDYGETKCLKSLLRELERRGHEVGSLFGRGSSFVASNFPSEMKGNLDLLITAISEANDFEVWVAKEANSLGIPVAVYAPGNGAYSKTSAAPMRKFTSLLLLGNKADEEGARKLFSKAEVFVVGNVLHEDGYPVVSRKESRQMLGVADDEKLIFVPGDKRLGINWPLFFSVVEATNGRDIPSLKPVIVIGIHPSDPNPIECYNDLVTYSRHTRVLIKTREMMQGVKIVPGCDLMVTACSTLAEVAAYQRKPVIGFFFENLLADLENQRGARFVWDIEEKGAADVVRNGSVSLLSMTIDALLSNKQPSCELAESLRSHQELHYPTPPEPGSTSKRAADAIEGKFFPH